MGALERIETGGTVRILDALFVANDPETGELVAVDLKGDGAGGIVAPLVRFRLEPAERHRATERTLSAHRRVAAETLRELGRMLEPGTALVAILLEHEWARAVGGRGGANGRHGADQRVRGRDGAR